MEPPPVITGVTLAAALPDTVMLGIVGTIKYAFVAGTPLADTEMLVGMIAATGTAGAATPEPPLPQPAKMATISMVIDSTMGLFSLSNLFILYLLKNHEKVTRNYLWCVTLTSCSST
jgi:hypothetical protein